MKYGKHFLAVIGLVALGSIGMFILLGWIYQLPLAASAEAGPIDTLFRAHFGLISFLFSLVMVFVLYSLVVFRRQPGDDSEGDHFYGHAGLEIAWTVLPLATVLFFGVWGARMLGEITSNKPDEMVVRVVGQQWSWFFEYPEQDNLRSLELVLPKGRPIRFHMESLDVIHSFWVPEFRVKQDLVPGQETQLRVTPTVLGEYVLRCAEMCGTQHSTMLASVRVVTASEFDDWVDERLALAAALPDDPAARGALWYEQYGCNACHSLDGAALVGPTWKGLWNSDRELEDGSNVRVDAAYLRRAIEDPNSDLANGFQPSVMPQNFAERIAADQDALEGDIDIIDDLIAFIVTHQEQ